MSKTMHYCWADSLRCRFASSRTSIEVQEPCGAEFRVIWNGQSGRQMQGGRCHLLLHSGVWRRKCLDEMCEAETTGRSRPRTEAAKTPPIVQTCHVSIHIINPTKISITVYRATSGRERTNMNKEVTGGGPIVSGKGIFCVYASRPWIRRLPYQNQWHAEEKHAILGVSGDFLLPRTKVERHLTKFLYDKFRICITVYQLTINDVFKGLNWAIGFVNLVKSGYLNQPTNVVRVDLVIHDPFRKFIPLIRGMTVYTDTPFNILNHDICQEFPLEINLK